MQDATLTEFSGVSGRVLARSVSVSSLITGVVLGLALLAGNFVLVMAKAPNLAMPFSQIVMALALVRFALNGIYGEWGGTVFSGAGGPWSQVVRVTGRYLALTAVWLVPMLLMGLGSMQSDVAPAMMMSGKTMWFLVIYMLGMTLTPPMFLIVAVAAESFGDTFRPETWKRVFDGRLVDLFAVYVVYVGALMMVAMLSVPLVLLAFGVATPLGFLVGGMSFCLVFGISINLLGRLCGFYACGELGLNEPPHASVAAPAPVAPAGDSRRVGVPGAVASASVPASVVPSIAGPPVVARPGTAAPAAAPRAVPVAAAPPAADPSATVHVPVAAPPAADPSATVHVPVAAPPPPDASAAAHPSPAATSRRRAAHTVHLPAAATVVADAVSPESEKRPPLLDAHQRVEAAMKRFAVDPESTVSALQDLNNSFAPHPQVLQALALTLYRTGNVEPAIQAALQAVPMCFARGHSFLAAELFREMKAHLDRLGLDREQLLTIAGALEKQDDLANAAKAHSTVIGMDPGETRAIKGMLQVADKILQEKRKPDAAAKVYRYLLEHCSSSPLAEYMRLGLEEAERKSGQPAAQGR